MSKKTIEKKLNKVSKVNKFPKMKRTLEIMAEKAEAGKKIDIEKSMLEGGYSVSSAHDCSITKTDVFQEMAKEYLPDDFLLGGLRELAEPTNDDKNTRLASLKEGFRLRDKYPASRLQLDAFKGATMGIVEDD
jgi:hypothetical protein